MTQGASLAASSPFVSALQLDAWGAVEAADADLTAQQRMVVIGTPIQVVFCKYENGKGGAWVTPPAARYGAAYHEVNGVTSYLGLVVSDGKIGAIQPSDVYQGTTAVPGLTNGLTIFRYGSMPDSGDGFNWTSTQTVSQGKSDILSGPISTSYTVVKNSVTSFAAAGVMIRVGIVNYQFYYRLLVNGALVDGGFLYSVSNLNIAKRTFSSPANVVLEIIPRDNPLPSGAVIYGQVDTTALVSGTVTDETSGFPINPGSGGTFEGLSCLAVRGGYPKEGGVNIPGQNQSESFSAGMTTTYQITKSQVTQFGVIGVGVKSTNVNQVFAWRLYVNGALAANNGASWPNNLTKSWSYLNPVDIRLEFISYNGGEGKPYPAGTIISGDLSYTGLGTKEGATSPEIYDRQVRCFVRNGIEVESVQSRATGSSNNFADLALYLLTKCGRVAEDSIDVALMQKAAAFTSANALQFNGVIASLSNVREYLQSIAPFFLLRFTTVNGRYGFAPLLPCDSAGAIATTPAIVAKAYGPNQVLSGSYGRTYATAAERQPVIVLVSWRNQETESYSVVNTTEVRYKDESAASIYQTYDASGFCTSFDHAALFGKYVQAMRRHSTHSIRFAVSTTEAIGLKALDVISVAAGGASSLDAVAESTRLYRVEGLADNPNGTTTISASYYPVDSGGNSLILNDVLSTSCEVT